MGLVRQRRDVKMPGIVLGTPRAVDRSPPFLQRQPVNIRGSSKGSDVAIHIEEQEGLGASFF